MDLLTLERTSALKQKTLTGGQWSFGDSPRYCGGSVTFLVNLSGFLLIYFRIINEFVLHDSDTKKPSLLFCILKKHF